MKLRLLPIAVVVAVLVSLAAVPFHRRQGTASLEKVTLAMPGTAMSALVFLALRNDFFARHGLDVTLITTLTGKAALNTVMAGTYDMAAVGSLSLSAAVADGRAPAVLATVAMADTENAIVARADRGISGVPDLRGKTIAVPLGSSAEYYLDVTLTDAAVPTDSVRRVALTPDDAVMALEEGKVDAVAVFAPWISRTARGVRPAVQFAFPLYTVHWNLATTGDFLKARPETASKVLAALLDAEAFARDEPQRAIDLVAEELTVPREEIAARWNQYRFHVGFTQSLLVALEDDLRWVVARGYAHSRSVPNFLDCLETGPLRKLRPEAVKITQ